MHHSFLWSGQGDSGTAIVLPGIQSYALGQALGLKPVLVTKYQVVVGYDYNTGDFDPKQIALEVADEIGYWQIANAPITLIGFSIGAPLSVLVVDTLRRRGVDINGLSVIMVDPPFGAATMKGVPSVIKPVAHSLFGLLSKVTSSGATMDSQAKAAADDKFAEPCIQDAEAMFDGAPSVTGQAYFNLARAADLTNQKSHSLRTWFGQLAWLTGSATKVPYGALRGVTVDAITADSRHNTVVDTNVSMDRWRAKVDFRRVLNADAEHCATLRHQPEYAARFTELLSY